MEDVDKYIKHIIELETGLFEIVKVKAKYIMNIGLKDETIIEKTLDKLLDFYFVDSSEIFYELNNYYEKINKENANEYKLLYKELKKQNE